MRVVIISGYRVGGTQFSKWLSKELHLNYIHEPFNLKWRKEKEDITGENILVKMEPSLNWGEIKDLNFDYKIGLVRINTNDCAISVTRSEERNEWHIEYSINDKWLKNNNERIIHNEKHIIKTQEQIINNKDLFQITYEGVYQTGEDLSRIKELFNIQNFSFTHYLDQINRYRKDNKLI